MNSFFCQHFSIGSTEHRSKNEHNSLLYKSLFILSIIIVIPLIGKTQTQLIDNFESNANWNFIKSDGVNVNLTVDKGINGKSLRFDYDFTKGTGYGGIQKFISIDLPENYEFSFYIKGLSPSNNFEIKFIDSTGNNVWWQNNQNFSFPTNWKKIRIKQRHISFAWGPTSNHKLQRISRIEFTIASFVGGKGTIWLDSLEFRPLPAETYAYPTPGATASSFTKKNTPNLTLDNSSETYWLSKGGKNEEITIDFKKLREFGGLEITWLKEFTPTSFNILLSENGKDWEKPYSVKNNKSNKSFIRLPEAECQFVKIQLVGKVGISDIKFLDINSSNTKNNFISYISEKSAKGDYPRYFSKEASYWTITGLNNDTKEALINEDGMVEVEKAAFSIEPMVKLNDKLFNWSNVNTSQTLEGIDNLNQASVIPNVSWQFSNVEFKTAITAIGEANKNSVLLVRYSFKNQSAKPKNIELYLLIRPYQVNPYYQFLNTIGGVGKINEIKEIDTKTISVDNKIIFSPQNHTSFTASTFDEGNIVDFIRNNSLTNNKQAFDPAGLTNGAIRYSLHLNPNGETQILLAIPFHNHTSTFSDNEIKEMETGFNASANFWKNEINHVKFNLPESANRIVKTYRANLAYILINRDKTGIQPGSRSYDRSWIRDGALTSSALLKSGIVKEVKEFIDWYSLYLFEDGKVPCVVDFRGPDPVPENDSHGEYIYLIKEYFNFTKDTAFLREKNKEILKVVNYIESLIAQRSTDYYKNGNDSIQSLYGLVPESISHEGYSAKPMHSYWDNFFTIKGLKDAAEIQRILGENKEFERINNLRKTFSQNLYNSIRLAMKNHSISYIPGCAELGDFDATSTTISLTPCNEFANLPKPEIYNTFDKYYEFFKNRRVGKLEWENYTPYENRIIGSFIMLNEPEKAHELIDYFLNNQRPQGWYHWAEVVWNNYRTPKFIGDMPHTWVGSDFINAMRTMFVYEDEEDKSLALAAALYPDWINSENGMSVENLPTYYGEVSYSIQRNNNSYTISIHGNLQLPKNGIKIKNFNGKKLPSKVTINGVNSNIFTNKEITVKSVPAKVVITY
ncbi:MAG TPA: discoidin domain-containing protein [Tenuifilaceae bacterium]|nr:discoidin domain-containing protein [Tenuifilaceae bacterium]